MSIFVYKIASSSLTPLYNAVRGNHVEITVDLIQAGANANDGAGKGNDTPLFIAAVMGYTEIVKVLLRAGANPKGNNSFTPLEAAQINNHTDIVDILTEAEKNLANTKNI